MNVIPETRRAHKIRYLRFYNHFNILIKLQSYR